MHAKSESDVTSLAPSSPPRSPKRGGGVGVGGANYYVQSPSRESHDGGYKSSSMQATPVYNSPNESPSHPSYGRHSRSSSVSRFSGTLRDGARKSGERTRDRTRTALATAASPAAARSSSDSSASVLRPPVHHLLPHHLGRQGSIPFTAN